MPVLKLSLICGLSLISLACQVANLAISHDVNGEKIVEQNIIPESGSAHEQEQEENYSAKQ